MWEAFALQKLLSFFSTKNISVVGDKVVKHLTSWPLNELVTGPCLLNLEDEVFPKWGLLLKEWICNQWEQILFFMRWPQFGSKFFSL